MPSSRTRTLLLVGIVALSLRLWWVLVVQPPGSALFSDMGGYLMRAHEWLDGVPPRAATLANAYGAHVILGLEMRVFGRDAFVPMAIVNACFSALAAVLVVPLARRAFPSERIALGLGLVTALWYPLVAQSGYFMSDPFYSPLLLASLLFWAQLAADGRSRTAALAGIATAAAFVVRPQILLTFVLGLGWLVLRFHREPWLKRALVLVSLPVVATVGYSALRHHDATGEWELISHGGRVNHFFARTEYRAIYGLALGPDGTLLRDDKGEIRVNGWFAREAPIESHSSFAVPGYAADRDTLEAERERVWASYDWPHRLRILARNVRHLAYGNHAWPESEVVESGWRRALIVGYDNLVRWWVVPLAAVGLVLLVRRRNPVLELGALHLLTLLYVGYSYLGNARYRIPYDPILFLFAMQVFFLAKEHADRQPAAAGPAPAEDVTSRTRTGD